jgi:hypothetical protein
LGLSQLVLAHIPVWIEADGTAKVPSSPGDSPPAGVTLDVKIGGVSATGTFRIIGRRSDPQSPYGSGCDSEPVSFQAAWVAPQ